MNWIHGVHIVTLPSATFAQLSESREEKVDRRRAIVALIAWQSAVVYSLLSPALLL
jgi:hypothetical protein